MSERIGNWIRQALLSNILTLSPAERMRSSLGAFLGLGLCGFLLHAMPLHTHWLLAIGPDWYERRHPVCAVTQSASPTLAGDWKLCAVHHGRHVGLTCSDVMSRDVVTAHFDTDLEVAWNQLRFHKIKSLPVVDHFERLIGIVTVADFLRQMDDTTAGGLAVRLQGLLRRTPGINSDKAEVVGQIMTADVFNANPDTPISDLVRQMAEKGLPHIPVVDAKRKVVGIVTQSDMLAALYKRIALSEASAA